MTYLSHGLEPGSAGQLHFSFDALHLAHALGRNLECSLRDAPPSLPEPFSGEESEGDIAAAALLGRVSGGVRRNRGCLGKLFSQRHCTGVSVNKDSCQQRQDDALEKNSVRPQYRRL